MMIPNEIINHIKKIYHNPIKNITFIEIYSYMHLDVLRASYIVIECSNIRKNDIVSAPPEYIPISRLHIMYNE